MLGVGRGCFEFPRGRWARVHGSTPTAGLSIRAGMMVGRKYLRRFVVFYGFEGIEARQQRNGNVVLVTGASSGIGAALAREISRRGGRVVCAARRLDRLEGLVEELSRS